MHQYRFMDFYYMLQVDRKGVMQQNYTANSYYHRFFFRKWPLYQAEAPLPVTAETRVRAPLQGQPSPFFWDFQGKFPMSCSKRGSNTRPIAPQGYKPDTIHQLGWVHLVDFILLVIRRYQLPEFSVGIFRRKMVIFLVVA